MALSKFSTFTFFRGSSWVDQVDNKDHGCWWATVLGQDWISRRGCLVSAEYAGAFQPLQQQQSSPAEDGAYQSAIVAVKGLGAIQQRSFAALFFSIKSLLDSRVHMWCYFHGY